MTASAMIGISPTHAAPAPGTFTISSNPTPTSTYGSSVTFTVLVNGNKGFGAGIVQFLNGGGNLGSPCTLASGTCSISASGLTVGAHTIAGNYTDTSGNYASGTYGSLTHTVNQGTAAVIVASSLDPSTFDSSVTFTVTVSAGGNGTGELTYATSTPNFCTVTKDGLLTGISEGRCAVTVTRASDGNYIAGTSVPLIIAIRK